MKGLGHRPVAPRVRAGSPRCFVVLLYEGRPELPKERVAPARLFLVRVEPHLPPRQRGLRWPLPAGPFQPRQAPTRAVPPPASLSFSMKGPAKAPPPGLPIAPLPFRLAGRFC